MAKFGDAYLLSQAQKPTQREIQCSITKTFVYLVTQIYWFSRLFFKINFSLFYMKFTLFTQTKHRIFNIFANYLVFVSIYCKKKIIKKNLWFLEINSNTSSDWMGFSLMCQQTTRNVVDVLVHISQSKGKISLNMRDSNSRSISRITLPSIVPSVGGFTAHGNLNSTWSNKTLVAIENF